MSVLIWSFIGVQFKREPHPHWSPLGGFIPVFFLGIPPSSEPGSGGDGGFHPAMAYEDLMVTKIGYQQLDNTLACSRLQDSGESESKNKREKPREDWEERVSRRLA